MPSASNSNRQSYILIGWMPYAFGNKSWPLVEDNFGPLRKLSGTGSGFWEKRQGSGWSVVWLTFGNVTLCILPKILCLWAFEPHDFAGHNIKHLLSIT